MKIKFWNQIGCRLNLYINIDRQQTQRYNNPNIIHGYVQVSDLIVLQIENHETALFATFGVC